MTIDMMSFGNCNWKLAAKLMILGALLSTTNVAKAQEVVPDNTLPQNNVFINVRIAAIKPIEMLQPRKLF